MSKTKIQRTWLECDFTWGSPPDPFTWDDVWLIIEAGNVIIGGGQKDWNKWQKKELEKKKKLIKLICTINGERFKESKYVNSISIEIKDMELLLRKLKETKINVTEIELLSESIQKAYLKILSGEK